MISKRPPRASLNNTPIRLIIASDGPIGNRKMPRIGSTPNRGTIGAKTNPRNASDLHLRLCRRGPFSQDGAPVLARTGPFSQDGAQGRARRGRGESEGGTGRSEGREREGSEVPRRGGRGGARGERVSRRVLAFFGFGGRVRAPGASKTDLG